jgi:hypothetical protein
MDTLIELIIRGLISLFSGSENRKMPQTPRSVPKIPPIGEAPARRPIAQAPMDAKLAVRRQAALRQQMIRAQKIRQIKPRQQMTAKAPPPPPLPRSVAPPAPKKTAAPIIPPAALRTIIALSEVVGPPLALRDD